ncbi:DUF3240 family protein [Marichromatium gracile]|uniref:DUF3240 domain-containing protein n=2 Tax=Marichromatium TaxID=85076 RepID=W0E329_MARPU|nr:MULTISPECIES: DUF3240 family protein [Marichromatium]MBO8087114.1 DUF3240 family protein [Marichromatium sp.]AHF05240.1 hypothetical protein MARPU_16320 [Marichromatium purpuratum 984]KXX65738.1 hypothetical protein AY586_09005 [Marichromatium gracile]MBK1707594.1 DUF3240 domain-containing protein [Marichromatium gracile]MCF1182446.1 DUF3240 family protein [Marichromatium gracile]
MTDHTLLYLVVPPAAAEALAEWLLERPEVPGFTSVPAAGHGASEHSLSLAEQVAGHSKRVMYLIHLPPETARAVLVALHTDFGGSGIHHWLVPVLEYGRL